MAILPVIYDDGTGTKPLLIMVDEAGGPMPAVMDEADPVANCCCGTCQDCIDTADRVTVSISGYVHYGPFQVNIPDNQFFEFFHSNLNGAYDLVPGSDPAFFPPYWFVDFGTEDDPDDPGILVSEFRDEDTDFWTRVYAWRLIARTFCELDEGVEKIRFVGNWVKQGFQVDESPDDLPSCAAVAGFNDLPEASRAWQEVCAGELATGEFTDPCPECPDFTIPGDFPHCVTAEWGLEF